MLPEVDFEEPKLRKLISELMNDKKFKSSLRYAKEKFEFDELRGQRWMTPVAHSKAFYGLHYKLSSDGRVLTLDKIEKIKFSTNEKA